MQARRGLHRALPSGIAQGGSLGRVDQRWSVKDDTCRLAAVRAI